MAVFGLRSLFWFVFIRGIQRQDAKPPRRKEGRDGNGTRRADAILEALGTEAFFEFPFRRICLSYRHEAE